jgi:hypothetical protein
MIHPAGAFVLLFAVSIYFLTRPTTSVTPNNGRGQNHLVRSPNVVVLVTTVLLFLLVTASWIIRILDIVWSIQRKMHTVLAVSVDTAGVALYIFQAWVADFLMVYRLYVICSRELWICVFPALCWLAAAVLAVFIIIDQSSLNGFGPRTNFPSKPDDLVIAAYCNTFILNVFCTAAILRRIWVVSRRAKVAAHDQSELRLSRSISIFVDSATMYTALYLATMLAFVSNKSDIAVNVLIYCTGPVAGLSFCLITVRVGLSRIQASSHPYNRSSTDGHTPSSIRHSPIVINVTRESHDDGLELGFGNHFENSRSLSVTD